MNACRRSKIAAPVKKILVFLAALTVASPAYAACEPGAYKSPTGDVVVMMTVPNIPAPALRYLFLDGRRGSTADADSPISCKTGAVDVRASNGTANWARIAFTETAKSFDSLQTSLAGKLIEPAQSDGKQPLVVMVHGSERTAALNSVYAYMLAAQGVSVFVYDKRGTGASEGDYTQNFELLAHDAAAALAEAQKLAAGRYGRSGYFGGSQGGWVAPLAAQRSKADFVAVGFGLVASPIEEDRDQMLDEARQLGLREADMQLLRRLSEATAMLLTSHFEKGYAELAAVKALIAPKPWAAKIRGEHSGAMLAMDETSLRRIGRAKFDNLELIWDYDAVTSLQKLDVPLLWVLAAEDREAPVAGTRKILERLIHEGTPIDLYLFPDTDHGMFEFQQNTDGTRTPTRITEGYLRLLGDWVKGEAKGKYGKAVRID